MSAHAVSPGCDAVAVDIGEHRAVVQQDLHAADVVRLATNDEDEMVWELRLSMHLVTMRRSQQSLGFLDSLCSVASSMKYSS